MFYVSGPELVNSQGGPKVVSRYFSSQWGIEKAQN